MAVAQTYWWSLILINKSHFCLVISNALELIIFAVLLLWAWNDCRRREFRQGSQSRKSCARLEVQNTDGLYLDNQAKTMAWLSKPGRSGSKSCIRQCCHNVAIKSDALGCNLTKLSASSWSCTPGGMQDVPFRRQNEARLSALMSKCVCHKLRWPQDTTSLCFYPPVMY